MLHVAFVQIWSHNLARPRSVNCEVAEIWNQFLRSAKKTGPGVLSALSHGCKVHKLILRRWWRHLIVWLSLSLYTIFTAHGMYKRELPELWSCSISLQAVHLRQCVQIFFTSPRHSILIKNPYNISCKKSCWMFIWSDPSINLKLACMLFALNVVILPVNIIKYRI